MMKNFNNNFENFEKTSAQNIVYKVNNQIKMKTRKNGPKKRKINTKDLEANKPSRMKYLGLHPPGINPNTFQNSY